MMLKSNDEIKLALMEESNAVPMDKPTNESYKKGINDGVLLVAKSLEFAIEIHGDVSVKLSEIVKTIKSN